MEENQRKPFAIDRHKIEFVFRGDTNWPPMVATLRYPTPDAMRGLYRTIWTEHEIIKGQVHSREPLVDYAGFFADHLEKIRRVDGQALPETDTVQRYKEWFKANRQSMAPFNVVNGQLLGVSVQYQNIGSFSLGALEGSGIVLRQKEYFGPFESAGTTVDKNQWTEVVIRLKAATVADDDLYHAAVQASFNRTGGKRVVIDPVAFTTLFKNRIQEIQNATFKGKPCSAETVGDWSSNVPYNWIIKTLVFEHVGAEDENFTRVSGKRSGPTG